MEPMTAWHGQGQHLPSSVHNIPLDIALKTIQQLWILNRKESETRGSTNVVFGTMSASHSIRSARKFVSLEDDLKLQTHLSYEGNSISKLQIVIE
jgi:hypothetical protein